MKFRLVVVLAAALCLTACDQRQKTFFEKNTGAKPDFEKAAHLNLEMGLKYLQQGQISRAKSKFVHALELRPKLPEAHSLFGYFYETVGDYEEAERHHKRAVAFGSGGGRYYNNYAAFLCRLDRFEEADKAFNDAISDKKYANTAEVYENAGLCALRQPNTEKARFYLETAIRRDPSRQSAYLELAKLEYDSNNLLMAKDYIKMYKSSTEPSARSVWLSLQLNKALGRKDDVASDALRLKNLFPDSKEYQAYLELQNNG